MKMTDPLRKLIRSFGVQVPIKQQHQNQSIGETIKTYESGKAPSKNKSYVYVKNKSSKTKHDTSTPKQNTQPDTSTQINSNKPTTNTGMPKGLQEAYLNQVDTPIKPIVSPEKYKNIPSYVKRATSSNRVQPSTMSTGTSSQTVKNFKNKYVPPSPSENMDIQLNKEYIVGRDENGKAITAPIAPSETRYGVTVPDTLDWNEVINKTSQNLDVASSNVTNATALVNQKEQAQKNLNMALNAPSDSVITLSVNNETKTYHLNNPSEKTEIIEQLQSYYDATVEAEQNLPRYRQDVKNIKNQLSTLQEYRKLHYQVDIKDDNTYEIRDLTTDEIFKELYGEDRADVLLGASISDFWGIGSAAAAAQEVLVGTHAWDSEIEYLKQKAIGSVESRKRYGAGMGLIAEIGKSQAVQTGAMLLGTELLLPVVASGLVSTISKGGKLTETIATKAPTFTKYVKAGGELVGKISSKKSVQLITGANLYSIVEGPRLIKVAVNTPERFGSEFAKSATTWIVATQAAKEGMRLFYKKPKTPSSDTLPNIESKMDTFQMKPGQETIYSNKYVKLTKPSDVVYIEGYGQAKIFQKQMKPSQIELYAKTMPDEYVTTMSEKPVTQKMEGIAKIRSFPRRGEELVSFRKVAGVADELGTVNELKIIAASSKTDDYLSHGITFMTQPEKLTAGKWSGYVLPVEDLPTQSRYVTLSKYGKTNLDETLWGKQIQSGKAYVFNSGASHEGIRIDYGRLFSDVNIKTVQQWSPGFAERLLLKTGKNMPEVSLLSSTVASQILRSTGKQKTINEPVLITTTDKDVGLSSRLEKEVKNEIVIRQKTSLKTKRAKLTIMDTIQTTSLDEQNKTDLDVGILSGIFSETDIKQQQEQRLSQKQLLRQEQMLMSETITEAPLITTPMLITPKPVILFPPPDTDTDKTKRLIGKTKTKDLFRPSKTRRHGGKKLRADLLSLTQSQARYGKATQPRQTKKLWKETKKQLVIRVPTKELQMNKKHSLISSHKDIDYFGGKKQTKNKRRKKHVRLI